MSDPAQDKRQLARVRVWDLFTRLFHWLLVALVAVAWYIGDNRSFTNIEYHFYLGYTIGGLVVARLLWGLIGPRPIRLAALINSPRKTVAYASTLFRRKPSYTFGHNPIGALSIIAMIVSLTVQVGTGLFAEDDGLFASGPLSGYASSGWVIQMNAIHALNSKILLGLIGLHIAAVIFYLVWKRENLIWPMISGWKKVDRSQLPSDVDH